MVSGSPTEHCPTRNLRYHVAVVAIASISVVLTIPSSGSAQTATPDYVPNELIVRFTPGDTGSKLSTLLEKLGAAQQTQFETLDDLFVLRLPPGFDVLSATDQARELDGVAYAEPNFVVRTQVLPNDPSFNDPDLWGLRNTGQAGGTAGADIDGPAAWDITVGSNDVVVVVIDTGIDYAHPDLAANMFRNTADCNSNGLDDDGNGYADDCHGIDTANDDSDPLDDNNHGTHTAGTIGAVGNNGVGVVGVNWNVKLMACKFLSSSGSGSTADAVTCLDYVALMKDRGFNIVATSNSWGGGGFSQALADAIEAQRQRGILFVAAAGDDTNNNDASPHYPASYDLPNVISVAATTRTDAQSSFSNFGRRTVHVGAPGSSILSTTRNSGYSVFNGTSMATPHVAGVAALLKAHDPGRDWRAIRSLIFAGGESTGAMAGTTITGKRLNAYGALTCSNSTVFSRVKPTANTVSGTLGTAIVVSALNINCAVGASATVVVNVSGASPLTLLDDGIAPDQAAGDGVYTASFIPAFVPSGNQFTLTFPDGGTVTVQMQSEVPYTVAASAYTYRTIAGTNLNLGDDTSDQVLSPFPILFGGGSFNTLFVSSNGTVNFASAFNSFSNQVLPASSVDGPLVAPFWDDLLPGSGGRNVFWAATGSTPNRELVIEWRDVRGFGCGDGGVTFQVVFFEGSSRVLFNYADTTFGGSCTSSDRGGSATIGIQVTATRATQHSFNTQTVDPSSALLWTYGDTLMTWTDDPL